MRNAVKIPNRFADELGVIVITFCLSLQPCAALLSAPRPAWTAVQGTMNSS